MAHRHEFTKPILPGKGATDYERYLHTDELLALQKTPQELLHKDEMTFLVVHQSSELLIRTIANGYRVKEVPVTMYKRESGTTKKGGNLAYGYRFSRVVFGTWWSARAQAKKNLPSKQGLWF